MNNMQVAKVVHEATRALAETLGGTDKKWEELTDQQRTDKTGAIGDHSTRIRKGIAVGDTIREQTEAEKLKTRLAAAITQAFSDHESDLAGGNVLHGDSESAQLFTTTSKDEVDRANALKRQNAGIEGRPDGSTPPPEPEPQNAEEANAQADAAIAQHNAEGQ